MGLGHLVAGKGSASSPADKQVRKAASEIADDQRAGARGERGFERQQRDKPGGRSGKLASWWKWCRELCLST